MTGEGVREDADALLRQAAKPERLWPMALVALVVYLSSSVWRIERPFGTSGRTAVLHALPTIWVPLAIVAVVVLARVAGRAEFRAGGSPWRWPRIGRRVLVGLAFALPVLSFAVAPALAVAHADAGSTATGGPLSAVVAVSIDVP